MTTKSDNKPVIKLVVGYFDCLISYDAEGALKCCTKSWLESEADGKWMKGYLMMFNDLVDASVIEVRYNTPNFAVVRVLTDNGIEEREYSVNVLREEAPYKLSETGDWGVVPISLRGL